jgi:short-subunit dehydrogenase
LSLVGIGANEDKPMNTLPKRRGWRMEALTVGALVGAWAWRRARRLPRDVAEARVLITGGSRGLGFLLAEEFARQGAHVAICGRSAATLEAAQAHMEALGRPILAFPCDITDPAQVARLVDDVTAELGGIDILVNNAGIITVGPALTQSAEDLAHVMAANFWGAVHLTEAVLPQMLAQHKGQIVNITSIGGKVSVPHLLPYSSAKFALVGYSQGLHAELARQGVRVLTVVPGLMRTGSYRHTLVKGKHRAEYTLFTILDSLPGISMDARAAAWQIVAAVRHGKAYLTLGLPAQIASRVANLFPGLTARLSAVVNGALPNSTPAGIIARRGADCETPLTRSFLTADNQRAAHDNNELVVG